MKKQLSIVLCFALVFQFFSFFKSQETVEAATARTAQIQQLEGKVTVKKAGGYKEFTAYRFMNLNEGDHISTGKDSSVVLKVVDRNDEVTISENSELYISELKGENATEQDDRKEEVTQRRTMFRLWKGFMWMKATPISFETDIIEIETPTAVMGVRGTNFLTSVNRFGDTSVFVTSGIVQASQNTVGYGESSDNGVDESDFVNVYPTQQVIMHQGSPNDIRPTVANLDSIIQPGSDAIIEAMLRNKRFIDEENDQFIKDIKQGILNNLPPTLQLDNDEGLERYQNNLNNLPSIVVNQAVNNGVVTQNDMEEIVNRVNEEQRDDIELNLTDQFELTSIQQTMLEQLKRFEEQRKQQREQRQQQMEQQLQQFTNILNQIQQTKQKSMQQNEQIRIEMQQEAEQRYLNSLTEESREQFIKRRNELKGQTQIVADSVTVTNPSRFDRGKDDLKPNEENNRNNDQVPNKGNDGNAGQEPDENKDGNVEQEPDEGENEGQEPDEGENDGQEPDEGGNEGQEPDEGGNEGQEPDQDNGEDNPPPPTPEPTIESINSIVKNVHYGNNSYSLPKTVKATMTDSSNRDVEVTWQNEVDTSVAGTFTYLGNVEGYGEVELTLHIGEVPLNEEVRVTRNLVNFEQGITLDFTDTNIPEGTKVSVKSVNIGNQELQELGLKTAGQILDIELLDYQLEDETIGLTLPINESANSSRVGFFYQNSDGNWEYHPTEIEDGKVHARLDHLSVYAVLEAEQMEAPVVSPEPGLSYYGAPILVETGIEGSEIYYSVDNGKEKKYPSTLNEEQPNPDIPRIGIDGTKFTVYSKKVNRRDSETVEFVYQTLLAETISDKDHTVKLKFPQEIEMLERDVYGNEENIGLVPYVTLEDGKEYFVVAYPYMDMWSEETYNVESVEGNELGYVDVDFQQESIETLNEQREIPFNFPIKGMLMDIIKIDDVQKSNGNELAVDLNFNLNEYFDGQIPLDFNEDDLKIMVMLYENKEVPEGQDIPFELMVASNPFGFEFEKPKVVGSLDDRYGVVEGWMNVNYESLQSLFSSNPQIPIDKYIIESSDLSIANFHEYYDDGKSCYINGTSDFMNCEINLLQQGTTTITVTARDIVGGTASTRFTLHVAGDTLNNYVFENNTQGTSVSDPLVITFDEPIEEIDLSRIEINDSDGITEFNETAKVIGNQLIIEHEPLNYNSPHILSIPQGTVKGSNGSINYEIYQEFYTEGGPLTINIDPNDQQTGVLINPTITFNFSKGIMETNESDFMLGELKDLVSFYEEETKVNVPFDLEFNSFDKIVISPQNLLKKGQNYTITINSDTITSDDLDSVEGDTAVTFTTGNESSLVPSGFTPSNGATGIATTENVFIEFSEEIEIVNSHNIKVRFENDEYGYLDETQVLDVFLVENNQLRITVDTLEPATKYTVYIPKDSVRGESGTNEAIIFTFTTADQQEGGL